MHSNARTLVGLFVMLDPASAASAFGVRRSSSICLFCPFYWTFTVAVALGRLAYWFIAMSIAYEFLITPHHISLVDRGVPKIPRLGLAAVSQISPVPRQSERLKMQLGLLIVACRICQTHWPVLHHWAPCQNTIRSRIHPDRPIRRHRRQSAWSRQDLISA